jgi:hypothetical protein
VVTSEGSQTTGINRIDDITNPSSLRHMAQLMGLLDLWDGAMGKLVT